MLTVRALMSGRPETVAPGTSLREVLARMNRDGSRHMPVVENGLLVGIITDRDVRLAVDSPYIYGDGVLERVTVLEGLTVASCMTRSPLAVRPDLPAGEAAGLLALHRFGSLPVVEDGRVVGIVTDVDFLGYLARNPPA